MISLLDYFHALRLNVSLIQKEGMGVCVCVFQKP